MSKVCLELRGIGKNFMGLRANDNISFQVYEGERLAIIGPNGAGKTTLFNIISGEFPPTDGQIFFYNEDVTKLPNFKRAYKGITRTYQITTLFMDQSILENVVLALMGTRKVKYSTFRSLKSNMDLFQEAEQLLAQVDLLEKKTTQIRNLSYGDQRLVELVMALAGKPKILCLDEPNAGLSVAESRIMVDVIKKLKRDITVLLIEHDMDLVFEVVDRILVLHDGIVVAVDETEKIRANKRVQQIYLGENADAPNI